jgi:predicted regulator of Ras-like GTPase activity (Roadblock/LC7/MglB family)
MKLRLAGFVRGLLRQFDDHEPARHVTPPAPATSPTPELSPEPSTGPSNNDATASTVAASDTLDLPLAPVIVGLPMDLKAKLMAQPQPGQTISLPLETIISQLAFGAVKVPFGEIRRLAPGIFANSGGEHDSRPVALPLQEILSRVNSTVLARRSVHKVEVSEEVAGPFDGRGRGVTFSSQSLKPPTPPVAAPTLAPPVSFTPQMTPPAHPRATTPEPEAFSFKMRQVAPAAPSHTVTPPAKPAPSVSAYSNGNGNGHGNGNGNGHGTGNGNGHANGNGSLPPFKFTTAAPVSSTPAVSSTPRPEPAQPSVLPPTLPIVISELAESWPDALKNELVQLSLIRASAPLPTALVESGLKKGRVTMTWKELRQLVKPNSDPSINDALALDLPLKVLAPAFLALQKKLSRAQTKVAVAAEIPNLFFGFPQAAPAATTPSAPIVPSAPAVMMPVAEMVAAAPAPAPVIVARPPADTNFYALSEQAEPLRMSVAPATDFMSRQLHPKDVVARAIAMAGVAGAVVTLADGLRVASEVPAGLNPDTISAFLPQIFEKVNQSTRELRMGALNNVSFTVGNVPWKIFRVNSMYFAAFGRIGEILPKAQLAALAAELDRKKQQ